MNPKEQFCPHAWCPWSGKVAQGKVVIHSRKERRYCCLVCGGTFAATQGTPFYRLRTDPETVTRVVTLLAYGCPRQAIVAAFGFDERTVAKWQLRAGEHCRKVHEANVCQGKGDLGVLQADELCVKMVGGRLWVATALCVPTRLWLAAQVSAQRSAAMARGLAEQVRRCARSVGVLVCVDGFAPWVEAFRRAFRVKVPSDHPGRWRSVLSPEFLLGQVKKAAAKAAGGKTVQQAICGTMGAVAEQLARCGGGKQINTAYAERFNATMRARLVGLIRRGRALWHQEQQLSAAFYLAGTVYNFCRPHRSLRLGKDEASKTPRQRTPAMAAGLTDHCWSVAELLHTQIPPPPLRWKLGQGRAIWQRQGLRWKRRPHRVIPWGPGAF